MRAFLYTIVTIIVVIAWSLFMSFLFDPPISTITSFIGGLVGGWFGMTMYLVAGRNE